MKKVRKTDLKKVVKKAEIESSKNSVLGLEVHTTKPISKPKNKRIKPKEKARDGKKPTEKKGREKTGIKKQQRKPPDKTDKEKDRGRGNKTKLPRVAQKKGREPFFPHEF